MLARITILFLCSSLALPKPLNSVLQQPSCQACHPIAEDKINIHLIPHSHDDVGWLKTVDQYYYGTHKKVYDASVQLIISSSIQALLANPERRYIQVEIAFFWKWWKEQSDEFKGRVIELVNEGRLEFINGGWTMNDEAATNYQSIIDQFTWGFRVLKDTFGGCATPTVGWQIDPFGHSREHASILAQMGFQGLVLGRIDYKDKEERIRSKTLDFIWESSQSLNNSDIFTTILPGFYGFVKGACFDVACEDYEPIVDDELSPDYNLLDKVHNFVREMDKFRNYYQTSNYLIPMGGDFNYQSAEVDFINMDKLIKGFKGHKKYNVFYSTPSCYVKAVYEEQKRKPVELTRKTDDFFPYSSSNHSIWTGYFTSRPTKKRFERTGNNILQASKQLTALSRINGQDFESSITPLKEVMGILQHHDAITGTEKQAVANDYVRMLTKAIEEAEEPIGAIIGDILKVNSESVVDLKLSTCLLANVSICEISRKNSFLVAVYNPLSRYVNHYVRLPVDKEFFTIIGPDGEEKYDIFERIHSFEYLRSHNPNLGAHDLVFAARSVPPFGVKLYYVETRLPLLEEVKSYFKVEKDEAFGTNFNGFEIDGKTGLLKSATLRGQKLDISQQFFYYEAASGTPKASGAYIFRPRYSEVRSIAAHLVEVKARRGDLVDEVVQVYGSEVTQIIRAYKNPVDTYIEFDWLVGDLQFIKSHGKEVITKFEIQDFENNGVFYTDSNGREQIKREVNKRSDYSYDFSPEPISSNYYPVTSKIVLKDEKRGLQVAVLTDRAQGGSSLYDGAIELMVHRRLPHDDVYGVGEALNEKEFYKGLFVRGQHYLTFGTTESHEGEPSPTLVERDLAHRKLLQPWVLLSDTSSQPNMNSLEKLQNLVKFEFSGLTRPLPENVKILTLEPWRDDTYLLRLENVLEKNEGPVLSQPVIVDLNDIFTTFFITEIGETTLGANRWLDDYKKEEKFIWDDSEVMSPIDELDIHDPLEIKLYPMQIRTFLIKVLKK